MNTLLLLAMLSCQSLDFGTTYAALHSGRFHEGNPAMRGPQLYALKVSMNVGMVAWHQLSLRHKPDARRWMIPVVFGSAGCFAGALNLHSLASAK